MKYICMNYPAIIRAAVVAALLATPLAEVLAEDNATGVRKTSCTLYDIETPAHWICTEAFDANGNPPVRGALILDAIGGQTKCHLRHQHWRFFDKNNFTDAQSCDIESYILPSGDKPDFDSVWAMIDRRSSHKHPASSKWIKIERGYMRASYVTDVGMKVSKKGVLEKVTNHDRNIIVVREGREYVHVLSMSVPASRYRSDEKFRRKVDNVWKNWKLKR